MALFDSSDDKTNEGPATQTAPAAHPTSTARPIPATLKDMVSSGEPMGEVMTSIGRGSRVSGKLRFDGSVRIEGTVEGEIAADVLQIGERAVVNAQISATVIVIRGTVTGDVHARKRVEVRAPGKLHGNVTTPSLVIDDGVTFEGYCSMGGEAKAPAPK